MQEKKDSNSLIASLSRHVARSLSLPTTSEELLRRFVQNQVLRSNSLRNSICTAAWQASPMCGIACFSATHLELQELPKEHHLCRCLKKGRMSIQQGVVADGHACISAL